MNGGFGAQLKDFPPWEHLLFFFLKFLKGNYVLQPQAFPLVIDDSVDTKNMSTKPHKEINWGAWKQPIIAPISRK